MLDDLKLKPLEARRLHDRLSMPYRIQDGMVLTDTREPAIDVPEDQPDSFIKELPLQLNPSSSAQ